MPQPDLCMETQEQLTDVMITCDHGEGIIGVIVQIIATQFIYIPSNLLVSQNNYECVKVLILFIFFVCGIKAK